MKFFDQFSKKRLLAAHRGFRAKYPENTMLSFEKSLGKCDFLEFDVQMSKDGVPIVFHDNKLYRTTNIQKYKHLIKEDRIKLSDFTYEEFKIFDLSSWFYKTNPFKQDLKEEGSIQRVSTLEEVIIFAKQNNLPLNVEIKYSQNHKYKKTDIQKILNIIQKHDYIKSVIISSFHHKYLKWVKRLDSSFATAALAHERYAKNNVKYLKKLGVEAYHINERLLHHHKIKEIIEAGFTVNLYTINDHSKFEEYYTLGVRTIFSDFLE